MFSCIRNGSFHINHQIFKGGHGDVYRAYKLSNDGEHIDQNKFYILKRMSIVNRPNILLCAHREIYFGETLHGMASVARYESYFVTPTDYWLVFRDEGISLQQLLYATTIDNISVVLKPSNVWRRFRTTREGLSSIREVMRQIITSIARLHKAGIVHRDIKLSNILLNTDGLNSPKLLIADFSSALSEGALSKDLFGEFGPSKNELTLEFAPPEVRLSKDDLSAIDLDYPESYDIWSIGVVFLEIILGTANVFDIDQRTSGCCYVTSYTLTYFLTVFTLYMSVFLFDSKCTYVM
jgi:serine/threonine protein kinase